MSKKFNPKVSILIPVYNGSNYVKEAIDSALAQTYKNIEVVVINDGSTDGGSTDKICKSYGNKIRYFVKENGGVATALNMGIEKMKGEYFSWLSHDDVYYPEKVEKQIEALSKMKNISNIVIYSDYELIDENSNSKGLVVLNHKELIEKPEYALLRGCVNGITLLVPKKAFDTYGGFKKELKCTQDYDMWRRIMKTYTFIHLTDIVTKTRIHELQDSNKHPNTVPEGNILWKEMIESLTKEDMIRLEGTEYNFYREMALFLEHSMYPEVEKYVKERMMDIYNSLDESKLTNTKVSVIIPFFNRVELLKKSIKSVLDQSHENWELLLIDDCSTGDISDIKEIAREDSRIRIISVEKNSGPAHARNIGIEQASGDYIAFLDSDDIFLPDKLENQLNEVILTGSLVSHTSYLRRDGKYDELVDTGVLNGDAIPKIIESCTIATPTVMIKTKYLHDTKIRFNEGFRIGEDTCFWLELLKNTKLLGIRNALTIVNTCSSSASINPEKQITGLGNILKFVLSDQELLKHHKEISNLCLAYKKASDDILMSEYSEKNKDYLLWTNKPSNPIMKALYLFKNQGFLVTIKKVIVKYSKRIKHKFTGK